jgi:hypothetical protein
MHLVLMAFPRLRRFTLHGHDDIRRLIGLLIVPFLFPAQACCNSNCGCLACTFLDHKIRAFARLQADGQEGENDAEGT